MIRIVDVNGQLKVTTNQQFRDNTFAILGSVDQTKRVRFEVDGLTTATTRTITTLDASGTMPLYEYAGTWTAAQTIDRGDGTLPTGISTPTAAGLLRCYSGAGLNSVIQSYTFGNTRTAIEAWSVGGTRAAPAATASGAVIFSLFASGHDGTNYVRAAGLDIGTDGLWSNTNRGIYWSFGGIPNGSTSGSEWMRLQNAMLGIGVTPATSGGSLQLGTGTTGGIGFQSGGVVDTRIYRSFASRLSLGDASNVGAEIDTTIGTYRTRNIDGMLICKQFDTFTSGAYNGLGRWGLLMTPASLESIIPAAGSTRYRFRAYNADSSIANTMLTLSDGGIGFFGTDAVAKPTITGSRGGNAGLASLLTAGANLGLWTDSTTA